MNLNETRVGCCSVLKVTKHVLTKQVIDLYRLIKGGPSFRVGDPRAGLRADRPIPDASVRLCLVVFISR